MPTALIIGASRGIGHELVRQYRHDGWRVIATARTPDACDALRQLGAEAHQLDVTDVEGCAALGWKLDDEKLDVAILNAACMAPVTTVSPRKKISIPSCTRTCWRPCGCCRCWRRWWRMPKGNWPCCPRTWLPERTGQPKRFAVPRQQGRLEFRADRHGPRAWPARRQLRGLPPGLGAHGHGRRRR